MSESSAPGLVHVPTLSESGYSKYPYVYTDKKNAPVTFFWWAKSPKGRESKYWQAFTFDRIRYCNKIKKGTDQYFHEVYVPTNNYHRPTAELFENVRQRSYALLSHLPKGYGWQGPFLLDEVEPPSVESDNFKFNEPTTSDGIQLAYALSLDQKGAFAIKLAQRVLANRGTFA